MERKDWIIGRRSFLQRGFAASFAVGGAGALLAACGDDDEGTGTSGGKDGGIVSPAGPATLKFVGWQGYDAKPPKKYPYINDWMKKHQLEITSTYAQDNEEMFTKIQASPPGTYALTSPYHGTVPTMIAAGALAPIETERMAHWKEIYPALTELDFLRDEDGTVFAVPMDFSYSVGLYNADKVDPLDRHADVLDKPELKGRYILIDAPEHFTWIAQYLDLGNPDPHHLTKDELEQCKELARKVVANAKAAPASYGDILQLMLTGEADWSLSGNPSDETAAQEKNVNIRTYVPKEGAQAFVDSYCIPKETEDYDSALAWIDLVISAKGQADITRAYGTGTVNPNAVSLLDPEIRKQYDYDNIDAVFDNAPVWPAIPAKAGEFASYSDWTKAWNEVK
jgi:spermidine/putrescine-binding protein